jgi:hypothetical protein
VATKANKGGLVIPQNIIFEPVTTDFDRATGSRREDPSFIVHPSGLSVSNVASAEDLDWLAEQAGETRKEYFLEFRASKEHKLVEIKIATAHKEGVQQVLRSPDGKTLSFTLGGVFKQYRTLAPKEKRQCQVMLDPENLRMILSLQVPKATRRRASKGEGEESAQSTGKKGRSRRKKQEGTTPAAQAPAAQAPTDEQKDAG